MKSLIFKKPFALATLLCVVLLISCQKENEGEISSPISQRRSISISDYDDYANFYENVCSVIEGGRHDLSLTAIFDLESAYDTLDLDNGDYSNMLLSVSQSQTYHDLEEVIRTTFGNQLSMLESSCDTLGRIYNRLQQEGHIDLNTLIGTCDLYDLSDGDVVMLFLACAVHNLSLENYQTCNLILDNGYERWFDVFTRRDSLILHYDTCLIYEVLLSSSYDRAHINVPMVINQRLYEYIDSTSFFSFAEILQTIYYDQMSNVEYVSHQECVERWMQARKQERERYERELNEVLNSSATADYKTCFVSAINRQHEMRLEAIEREYAECINRASQSS